MTEPGTDSGTPEAVQKMRPGKVLVIVSTTVVVVVGSLLYLMWEWYADPDATWQHWAWILIQVGTPIWVVGRLIAKASDK